MFTSPLDVLCALPCLLLLVAATLPAWASAWLRSLLRPRLTAAVERQLPAVLWLQRTLSCDAMDAVTGNDPCHTPIMHPNICIYSTPSSYPQPASPEISSTGTSLPASMHGCITSLRMYSLSCGCIP